MAPSLVVLSVGDNDSNASYFRGLIKRIEDTSDGLKHAEHDAGINQKTLLVKIGELNNNNKQSRQ